MIKLSATIGGRQHDYEVPLDLSDISYSAYLDFRKAEENYFRENAEAESIPRETLEKALSFVITGDLSVLPFNTPGDDPATAASTAYRFDYLSILRLYGHISALLDQAEAHEADIRKSLEVSYKGEKYYLEPDAARRFGEIPKGYTIGEVVTIDESDRLLTDKIEGDGDPSGSLEFERELRALAVLLRKDGEELPVDITGRARFLEDRAVHFKELPADVVLQVRFFLHAILKDAVRTLLASSFLRAAQA